MSEIVTQLQEQWVGAYYPGWIIEQPRSRAIACLLFDKVVCHFPIAGTSCGGGAERSHELLEDDAFAAPLVEADVLEVREEFLLDEIERDFTPGHCWGTEEEFDRFFCLQVTGMALSICAEGAAVPVTDNPGWPIPGSLVAGMDNARFAGFQAAALAMRSLDVVLPPIGELSGEDLLQARHDLREQLIPFRRSMLSLAPTVRAGMDSGASCEEVYREAEYVVQTRVIPALGELQDRIAKEKGRFSQRLLVKGAVALPKFALNWMTKGALCAAVDGIGDAKALGLGLSQHGELFTSLKNSGELGFLLSAADHPSFRQRAGVSSGQ